MALKNVSDIPLLLLRMFPGPLLNTVILQQALMGLRRYRPQPSEIRQLHRVRQHAVRPPSSLLLPV